ncbi:hypothetical protein H4R21_002116 [Coemansia helicoidea]|uniref:Uncharacterized protein n=2 Tax=Coemansia TaxID=4863 RepID=A0ACC1L8L7_9FUNG|nr:hypothetical protein H4R21_002116 [Coemansia helicoidea]
MRWQSPQAQLGILFAHWVLLIAVPGFLTPCAMSVIRETRTHVFGQTWHEQLLLGVLGLVAIPATTLLGPRVVLLFGSLTGTLLSVAAVVGTYGLPGWYSLLVAAKAIDNCGRTMARVCTGTVVLTYPREQRKARVLALFQLVVDVFLTMGHVLEYRSRARLGRGRTAAEATAWSRLAFTCVSAVCVLGIVPVTKVVRDSGVFVLARPTPSLKEELRRLARVFGNRYMLLLVPHMFSQAFTVGILGASLPNFHSVLLYNVGSLSALGLAAVLDVGSQLRKRRAQLGFAAASFVTAVCVVLMAVLNTRSVDVSQLPSLAALPGAPVNAYRLLHYRPLFYAAAFFTGMAVSCAYLFSGWVIGSLTNDVEYTARFSGTLLSVPALGTLTALLCLGSDSTSVAVPSNVPLYVGAGLLVLSSCAMYYVVHHITDTNDWSLICMAGTGHHTPSTAPLMQNCVVSASDDASFGRSSIAKRPLPDS